MTHSRLKGYLFEALKHKEHILDAKDELELPITSYEKLPKLQKFALNTLIFRFSKLQDLMGIKIFRAYLEYLEFPIDDLGFFDILKAIEKENITDIDTWSDLRELRNDIAHDYPDEFEEMIEKINVFVSKSQELIDILERLETRYNAINSKRG